MSAERSPGNEDLVSVYKAHDEADATLVRDFLADQGIEASIVSAQIPWLGTIEVARKGYWGQVEVLEPEAEKARKLIEEYLAARPAPDEGMPGAENGA
ncbi:MAG: hypothetical protein ACRENN_11740 [Candidatus Eiseniibacteriota bacterium]